MSNFDFTKQPSAPHIQILPQFAEELRRELAEHKYFKPRHVNRSLYVHGRRVDLTTSDSAITHLRAAEPQEFHYPRSCLVFPIRGDAKISSVAVNAESYPVDTKIALLTSPSLEAILVQDWAVFSSVYPCEIRFDRIGDEPTEFDFLLFCEFLLPATKWNCEVP